MQRPLPVADCLPADHASALLVGRAWKPGANGGPCVVAVRGADLVDLTPFYTTSSGLLDGLDLAQLRNNVATAARLGAVADIVANSDEALRER